MAVVGSGPAGLAAAQQLARAGHAVTVFERAEKPGGLLRYGIPEFKMEKAVLDRRLAQMEAEGVNFGCSTAVGRVASGSDAEAGARSRADSVPEPGEERGLGTACAPDVTVRSAADVRAEFDAVVLAGGATLPRDLPVPGRASGRDPPGHGLPEAVQPGPGGRAGGLADHRPRASTWSSSAAATPGPTAWARSIARAPPRVHQLEIMPEPPRDRLAENPWPTWPLILRTSAAHEEGGERLFAVTTAEFVDDGRAPCGPCGGRRSRPACDEGRPVFEPVAGTEFELPCELVLLAMGFLGTERRGVVAELGLEVTRPWHRGGRRRRGPPTSTACSCAAT